MPGDVLLDEQSVVLLDGAAEELEEDGEADDADAGAGEHALGGDLPVLTDEAGVDGVVVEHHVDLAAAHAHAVVAGHAGVVHGRAAVCGRRGGHVHDGGGCAHGHVGDGAGDGRHVHSGMAAMIHFRDVMRLTTAVEGRGLKLGCCGEEVEVGLGRGEAEEDKTTSIYQ